MARAKIDREERELYESFFRLMAFTRSKEVHKWALSKLKSVEILRPHLDQIEDKLKNFCKYRMCAMFNCGLLQVLARNQQTIA